MASLAGHLVLFRDSLCRGDHWHVFNSVNRFDPDNVVSSFVILQGNWQFFADPNFQSQLGILRGVTLGPGIYASITDALGGGANDKLSSLRLV